MSTNDEKWVELSYYDRHWIKETDDAMREVARAAAGEDYFAIRTAESKGYPGDVKVTRYLETGSVGAEYVNAKAEYDKMQAAMEASGKPIHGNSLYNGSTQARYMQACIGAAIESLDVYSIPDSMLPPNLAEANRRSLASNYIKNPPTTEAWRYLQQQTQWDEERAEKTRILDAEIELNGTPSEKRASIELNARLEDSTIDVVQKQVRNELAQAILSGDSLMESHTMLILAGVNKRIEVIPLVQTEFSP